MGVSDPLWHSVARPSAAFDVLEGTLEADVCVVGLGGSGLTAIGELLDLGASVVGVDRGVIAGGAAGRNGGLLLAGLAPFYHDARSALGAERARALYGETIAEQERVLAAAPAHVRRTGSLRIAASDDEEVDCAAQLDAMRSDGLPVEPYSGPEGNGLRFPTDMSFNPLARCRALAASAAHRGARLFERSEALEIRTDGIRSPNGEVRAGRVIVAVDGRLDTVLPELADDVRTARLQMLGTAQATDVSLPTPMYVRYGYEYAQQLPDGRLAVGGFRDHHEAAEWTDDQAPTDEIQDLLTAFLRTEIGTSAEITHRWGASVGYSKGALPIFKEVRDGVIAIGGYSGTGNLVGALCGRAAAQLACGSGNGLIELLRGSMKS